MSRFEGKQFRAMTLQVGALVRRLSVGFVVQIGIISIYAGTSGANALDKLVDPNTVAPEYRAAAEKRRAEQLKLFQCSKKADEAKVMRRDRGTYINACLDK
jgi:hypothetical protein